MASIKALAELFEDLLEPFREDFGVRELLKNGLRLNVVTGYQLGANRLTWRLEGAFGSRPWISETSN